jgi:rhodanese-related sulfurtransferase
MKLSITFICLILTGLTGLSGQVPDSLKYQSVEPYDFHLKYLNEDSALIVDVREPFEFRGKRIRDAINIPSSGNIESAIDTLDKNYSLFFYCSSGYRSKRMAIKFYDQGFRKLYNLDGGITEWRKEGYPVVRKREGKKRG